MNVKKLIYKVLLIICVISLLVLGTALAIMPTLYALIGIVGFGVLSCVLTALVIGEQQ